LVVAAYGSYLPRRADEATGLPFTSVLDSAIELGAPTIRVGRDDGVRSGDSEMRAPTSQQTWAEFPRSRGSANFGVARIPHRTLTDTADSTTRLLDEVGSSNLFTYWQPPLDPRHGWMRAGFEARPPE